MMTRSNLELTSLRVVTLTVALIGATAVFAGCVPPPARLASQADSSPPRPATCADYRDLGYNNIVACHGADPTGKTDTTAAIQAAIDWAGPRRTVVYFPRGTYLVSDTLEGKEIGQSCGNDQTYALLGQKPEPGQARPKILLADNAPGFQSGHKPVVKLWKERGGRDNYGCAKRHGLAGIDIDIGNGNSDAVGVFAHLAQDAFLYDVRIEARDGFAGLTAIPGRNMSTQNIEVVGGQYGFHLDGNSLGATLVGVTLKGQKQAAIFSRVAMGLSITGFAIEKDEGPAIVTEGNNARYWVGNLALHDGRIELRTQGTAIDNSADNRVVSLRNVYVKGAAKAVDNGVDALAGKGAGWMRVDRYTYCPEPRDAGFACWNFIDGERSRDVIAEVTAPSPAPPDSLVTRNVWEGSPSFEDTENVVYATDPRFADAPDDRAMIQAAIDYAYTNGKIGVFLPKGTYDLSGPITLKSTTHLFGPPAQQAILRAEPSWVDGLDRRAWMIETEDDAEATTSLEHVIFDTPDERGEWLGALRWRAGRNSAVRTLRFGLGGGSHQAQNPRHIFHVTGHGGGRWYAVTSEHNADTDDPSPGYRKLMVQNTSGQPLTFYGFNPEGGVEGEPMVELNGAANVRLLGSKSEGPGYLVSISNSRNVYFAANGRHPGESSRHVWFEVNAPSNNIEMTVIFWKTFKKGLADLFREGGGYPRTATMDRDGIIGAYRRGRLDWSAWPERFESSPSLSLLPIGAS